MQTGQRILEYLKESRQASAPEIARALGMTRPNIRYHLASMRAAGLVEIVNTTRPTGRGRPIQVYRLAISARSNNLNELTGALLSVLLPETLSEIEREQLLEALADQLAPDSALSTKGQTSLLNRAIRYLDERGYAAAWEARPQGPVIRLRNCPYAAQIAAHPELCQMDQRLLERLTGLPAQHIARIDLARGTPPACVFQIKARTDLTGAQD